MLDWSTRWIFCPQKPLGLKIEWGSSGSSAFQKRDGDRPGLEIVCFYHSNANISLTPKYLNMTLNWKEDYDLLHTLKTDARELEYIMV